MTQLIDEARNVRHGVVRSAVPLTEAQLERLRQVLRETICCEVILETEVKPEIIGGLEVRIGDMLLDGSLRMRLDNVRDHFQRERELAARGLSG
jgi:F-type H+-transporting ATPase subunit delta